MKGIKEYFTGVSFSLGLAFKFAPIFAVLIGLFFALSSVVSYGNFYVLGKIVDSIVAGVNESTYRGVMWLLVFYAGLSTLPHILANIRRYLVRKFNLELSKEGEIYILSAREKIDIARYEDPSFQDLIQRAFRNGLSPIYNLINKQFDFFWNLTSFVTGTILILNFSPQIYLIILLSAIPGFIIDIKFASRGWTIWAKDSPEQRRFADLRQHINSKTFLIETKLLQSKNKILGWARQILTDFKQKQVGNEKSRVWIASLGDILAFGGTVWALYLVLQEITVGQAPVGNIVYLLGVISRAKDAVNSLLVDISIGYEDALIAKDMKAVIEVKPLIIESENPSVLNLKSAPEIVFQNVSFKYANSEKNSLKNVSLKFNAGDNIGLVGNNGAGKTTLVKLLCRIYDPTEGRILINGVDLREISTQEWWSYLAVMFQDYASYDFVVKDAIAIGRPNKETNLTKVVEAAHTSQAHTFIEDWDGKYNEQLGVEFKGKEPSKGQRQKLSIAKVLYRDGFVMVLDEPTASVDAESEAKIFDSIENLPKDRTAILISHDFSTISECDKIFVLDKGELIEEGDHKHLMSNKGMYAELYNLQAKRFKK